MRLGSTWLFFPEIDTTFRHRRLYCHKKHIELLWFVFKMLVSPISLLLWWLRRCLSPHSSPGSLLMCAPSSVETSTSTGSGDWLNREGGVAGWQASSSQPGFQSRPPFPHRRPASPLWASGARSWRRGGLGRAPDTGWTVMGSPEPRNYWGGRGSHLFFFCLFFFFFDSLFVILNFFFLPQNKTEPLCLIAPDTDCVRMKVSLCVWVGVRLLGSLVPF